MRRVALGASIAIIILSCTSISYSILHNLYGEGSITTSVLTTTFENYGQDATVQWSFELAHRGLYDFSVDFSVVDVEEIPNTANNYVYLSPKENAEYLGGELLPLSPNYSYKTVVGTGASEPYFCSVEVSDAAWDAAVRNEGPVTSTSETKTSETEPIDVMPISSVIGIAVGVIAITAVWVGHRHPWGDAASTLFEHGLTNMTVRDVKIFGEILKLEKFTIPQLMKQTHSSKITVWRAVQKFIEEGLVQSTGQSIPSSNGLGGRGKPSRVYKYISKE